METTDTIFTAADLADVETLVSPLDMRAEIVKAIESGAENTVEYRRVGPGVDTIHYAFFPQSCRGAVCLNGDSQWTDCSDLDDLADRYDNYDDRWSN